MRVVIEDVLDTVGLAEIRAAAAQARFRDGRLTAGGLARRVKRNEQAKPGEAESVLRALAESLRDHPLFRLAARPLRLSPLMLSRYRPGMAYGRHVDDAVMQPQGGAMRADVAFTVFLSDPASYEGGALTLREPLGDTRFRPPAGAAVVYPADTLHEVEPVTAGERLAIVGWAQSLVRDASARQLLFDLEVAAGQAESAGAAEAALGVRKAVSNLLRRWAEL